MEQLKLTLHLQRLMFQVMLVKFIRGDFYILTPKPVDSYPTSISKTVGTTVAELTLYQDIDFDIVGLFSGISIRERNTLIKKALRQYAETTYNKLDETDVLSLLKYIKRKVDEIKMLPRYAKMPEVTESTDIDITGDVLLNIDRLGL